MIRHRRLRSLRALLAFATLTTSLVGVDALASAHATARATTGVTHRPVHVRPHGAGSATSPLATTNASQPTNRANNARTGWYADQGGLAPSVVASSHFGQIFNTPVDGQVYAQPLVDAGVLIVATMRDWVYGMNPTTGRVEWSRQIATPFYQVNAWTQSGKPCNDVGPYVGVLSTPTVDPRTGVIYLVNMAQDAAGAPSYWMQALNPLTGASEPGFPVEITGAAANDPALSFDANLELQRPGLLELNGTIYAAFSSHCDQGPFYGFVAGVTTAGALATIWTDVTGQHTGGGIWQSGGGLVQYGNDILLASGNGYQSPAGTIPGDQPPSSLGESVVDLKVNADGSLTPVDFFAPYDAAFLDANDLDVGSGAPVLLPSSFGTPADPHVVVQESKSGYLYLLNGDHLGGVGNGVNGGDAALSVAGPYGGIWATPAAMSAPGGGYLYVPTATGGTGSLGNAHQGNFDVYYVDATGATPILSEVATAGSAATGSTAFGYGAASPVVTSKGGDLNSGVVWVIRSANALGDAATLQAYRAQPQGRWLTLINQWSIGRANKFTSPGVWNNTLYVATADGHVRAFGVTRAAPLSAPALSFAPTQQGATSASATVTLRVRHAVRVDAVTVLAGTSGAPPLFHVLGTTPSLAAPRRLRAGATLRVRVDFTPGSSLGAVLGTLEVSDSAGTYDVPLAGLARAPGALLYLSTRAIDFGGVALGASAHQSLSVTNEGSTTLSFGPSTPPANGFTLANSPAPGTTLAPGGSLTLSVSYAADVAGAANSSFTITTSGPTPQSWTVALAAYGAAPGALSLTTSSGSSNALDLGSTTVGASTTGSFTLTNVGGATVTLVHSKEPSDPNFTFDAAIPDGDQLAPGASVRVDVTFQPASAGAHSATWSFSTNAPGATSVAVTMTGVASGPGFALPAIGPDSGWRANGVAQLGTNEATLTGAVPFVAGSAYWPVALASGSMTFSYTSEALNGDGANGSALVLADASRAGPSTLGHDGPGLGFDTNPGVGVVLADYPAPGSPAALNPTSAGHGWVAITDGWDPSTNSFHWLAGVNLPASLGGVQDHPLHVVVSVHAGMIDVTIDGVALVSVAAPVAATVFAGFAASTGLLDNAHVISDARVTLAGAPLTQRLALSAGAHFRATAVGTVSFATARITNPTNTPVTATQITTTNGAFVVASSNAALSLAPGASANVLFAFQPSRPGAVRARALLALPGSPPLVVVLAARATGRPPTSTSPSLERWRANGSARVSRASPAAATLTADRPFEAGSLFSPRVIRTTSVTVSLRVAVSPGTGADGVAVLFTPGELAANFLGSPGWGLGFAPARAALAAVVLSEIREPGAPSPNFVGLASGGANGRLFWRTTAHLNQPLASLDVPVFVSATRTALRVWINGVVVLRAPGLAPGLLASGLRVGISGSTGALSDAHAVSDVRVTNS